jgi:hypothetical protein
MKKSQLKKLLKPIVKECIEESLLEGILSKVISEVVKGVGTGGRPQPVLQLEQKDPVDSEQQRRTLEQKWDQERERKRKILDATGLGSEIFEGLNPIADPTADATAGNALSGVDPQDAGVDINGIMALGGNHWKQLIK